MCANLQANTRTQKYLKVPKSTSKYPKVPQSTQNLKWSCDRMCANLQANTWKGVKCENADAETEQNKKPTTIPQRNFWH